MYVHIRDQELIQGSIELVPCNAHITMYFPLDSSIRKAVIVPTRDRPHNHPSNPAGKLSLLAQEAYVRCALAFQKRALGATVTRVDQGTVTIF